MLIEQTVVDSPTDSVRIFASLAIGLANNLEAYPNVSPTQRYAQAQSIRASYYELESLIKTPPEWLDVQICEPLVSHVDRLVGCFHSLKIRFTQTKRGCVLLEMLHGEPKIESRNLPAFKQAAAELLACVLEIPVTDLLEQQQRVKAHLSQVEPEKEMLHFGSDERSVYWGNQSAARATRPLAKLSPKQFRLLQGLYQNRWHRLEYSQVREDVYEKKTWQTERFVLSFTDLR